MRTQRRRKQGAEEDHGLKLPIPQETENFYPPKTFMLRWFRNEDSRIKTMHGQDWDLVEGVDPVPGATDRHGNPVEHVLMVKRRDWYEEDRAWREDRRKETERRVIKGDLAGIGAGEDAGEALAESIRYTGNNQI